MKDYEERFLNVDTKEWCSSLEELIKEVGDDGFTLQASNDRFKQRVWGGSKKAFCRTELTEACRIKTYGSMDAYYEACLTQPKESEDDKNK